LARRDYEPALHYFRKANELNSKRETNSYVRLYRALAFWHLGHGEAAKLELKLESERAQDSKNKWIPTIVDILLGRLDLDNALKLAKNNAENCDIYFYSAQRYLLRGEMSAARKGFAQASRICNSDWLEWYIARAELLRLTK